MSVVEMCNRESRESIESPSSLPSQAVVSPEPHRQRNNHGADILEDNGREGAASSNRRYHVLESDGWVQLEPGKEHF